jgi:F-type H+-transporting ATPase subunit delta
MARGVSARRHAQAVFQIALEKEEIEKWQADLEAIASALKNPELVALLENPKLLFSQKEKILQSILTGVSPIAMNLIYFLVAKNRLRIAEDLLIEYQRLVNAYYGRETAEVVTAIPLSNEEKERLQKRLAKVTRKEVVITTQVDPEIIGGVMAKVGDKLIDGSVRTRLQDLRKGLIEAGLEVR